MTDTKDRNPEDELREKLAAIEHERWADWQKWVHDCMDKLPDGAFLPLELWVRWEKQIKTPYEKLSEREKQSDRDQVDRYWHLIEDYAHQQVLSAVEEKLRMLRKVLGESIVEFIDQELATLKKEKNHG